MIQLKRPHEIEGIRTSGKVLAECLLRLDEIIKEGVSTWDIDKFCYSFIKEHRGIPSCLGYCGYPNSACVSVNEEVVHGIPTREHILKEGDIVSLDAGLIYKGYHSDAARTHAVGSISEEKRKLMEVTKQSFFEGIKMAKAGNHLFDISEAIDSYVSAFGYGIVRDLVGHGIGTSLHEDPQIPNFKQGRRGLRLQAGMTLAIEPMINMGTDKVLWLDDNWTVISADHSPSAHYENTVLITDGEPEILTLSH